MNFFSFLIGDTLILLFKIFRCHTKLFLEYLTEIRRRVDTYQVTYFPDPVLAVEYQFCCFLQADETDKVIRRQSG